MAETFEPAQPPIAPHPPSDRVLLAIKQRLDLVLAVAGEARSFSGRGPAIVDYSGSVRGSPKCESTPRSRKKVMVEISSPSSVSTISP